MHVMIPNNLGIYSKRHDKSLIINPLLISLFNAGTKSNAEVQWYFVANNSKPLIFTNCWELKEAVSVVTEPEVISLSSSV